MLKRILTFSSPSSKRFYEAGPAKRRKLVDWTAAEEEALVEFIALHRDETFCEATEWPGMNPDSVYWKNAAIYISNKTKQEIRTGKRAKH